MINNSHKSLSQLLKNRVQHYNHEKYWKYRNIVINPDNKTIRVLKKLMLYYIKKCEAFNNAEIGTTINQGAIFASPPNLPHGLKGIVISQYARIGRNVTIYHQVTIAQDDKGQHKSAVIGDNVVIGTGAKIIGNVRIGNNVKIGANAVVVKDIADNCTAVGVPAKIINKQ